MDNQEIFERMADRYDTPDRVEVAHIITAAIRAEMADARGKAAMDYGCGTGLVGLELVDLVDSMLFVDASPQMIARVDEKIRKTHIENAQALCADFQSGAPADIHADYIFMSQVLLHVREYASLLAVLYGMLSKGGHLLIVDFDRNEKVSSDRVHNGFEQMELMAQLRGLGFSSANAHTFYHGESLFMNQDATLFILHAVK